MEKIICEKCDTENPIEAKYCRNCGCKLKNVPEIHSFTITPIVHTGDTVRVCWDVENADTVTINGKDVVGKKEMTLTITQITTLNIVAIKNGITASKSIVIKPISQLTGKVNPQKTQINRELEEKNYHIKFLVVLVLLLLVLLYIFSYEHQLVHYYVHVSYRLWNSILKGVRLGLCIGLSVAMLFLLTSIIKYIKDRKIKI